MEFELESIDHIHIYVSDRVESEKWYKSVLGLTRTSALEFWAKDGGPLTLQNSTGSIHLALFERPLKQYTTVAFKVSASGLHAYIEHLSFKGIKVKPVDHDVSWSVYFKDPDDNPYEITTYEYELFSTLDKENKCIR